MRFLNFRNAPTTLVALFLAGIFFLTACSGEAAAQVQAVIEAQTQSGAVESVEEEVEEAAPIEAEVVAEADDDSEADQVGEAENLAEVAEELSEEVSEEAGEEEVRTVPVLTLGDPTLRGTDPSTVQLASGRIQLIEFFAYWCPTCKRMAPTVHGLEDAYGDEIGFVYLDRDDPATASFRETLGYIYQPHYFLLNPDGIVLGSWIGYTDSAILQDAIERALQ